MNTRSLTITLAALVAASVGAQETDNLEIETLDLTMELMPEGATLPEAVTRVIELPAAAAGAARASSSDGLDAANAARERREAGLETAAEAREQGRERAQQAQEEAGRGPPDWPPGPPAGAAPPELPGDLPGGPPEGAGPPETPGPPGN